MGFLVSVPPLCFIFTLLLLLWILGQQHWAAGEGNRGSLGVIVRSMMLMFLCLLPPSRIHLSFLGIFVNMLLFLFSLIIGLKLHVISEFTLYGAPHVCWLNSLLP